MHRLRAFDQKFFAEERIMSSRMRARWLALALFLVVGGSVLFGITLLDVQQRDDLATMDVPMAGWLREARSPVLTPIMIALAVVFGPIVLSIIVLFVTITWGLLINHAWRPVVLALGTLAAVVAVRITAELVQRARPPVSLMLFGPDASFSFPSGHVVGAAEFGLLASYLVFSRGRRVVTAILAVCATVGVVVVLGISRIYLGYHWATDVLASVSIALVILGIVVAIDTMRTARIASERSEVASGREAGYAST